MRYAMGILALGLCFAWPAHAQDMAPGDEPFKDWLAVSDLLRSKNIDVDAMDWTTINAACLPERTDKGDVAYNRCRYKKALEQKNFMTDSTNCNEKSLAKYPEGGEAQRGAYTSCMSQLNWANPDSAFGY